MAFVLTLGNQPLRLRRKGNRFGQGRAPEVKHPLRVFSKPDKTVLLSLALNDNLRPVARDDWNVLAWPLAFLKDFHGRQLAPLDLFTIRRALVHDGDA